MSVVILTCVHVSNIIFWVITGHNVPCQMGQMRLGCSRERVRRQVDRAFVTNRTRTIHLHDCLVREYRIFGIKIKFHLVGERDVPVPMKGLTKAV
jgi:hypothetical protein